MSSCSELGGGGDCCGIMYCSWVISPLSFSCCSVSEPTMALDWTATDSALSNLACTLVNAALAFSSLIAGGLLSINFLFSKVISSSIDFRKLVALAGRVASAEWSALICLAMSSLSCLLIVPASESCA